MSTCCLWSPMAAIALLACSTRERSPQGPADVPSYSEKANGDGGQSEPPDTRSGGSVPDSDLPEGPCQESVRCEEVQASMKPYFNWNERRICFWDPDARCKCAEQLGVDDSSFCSGHYSSDSD